MQGVIIHDKNIPPSVHVRPSVKRVNHESNFCQHFYAIWKIDHPIFRQKKVGGDHSCTKNVGLNWHRRFRNADFRSAHSASAVTPSEKKAVDKRILQEKLW